MHHCADGTCEDPGILRLSDRDSVNDIVQFPALSSMQGEEQTSPPRNREHHLEACTDDAQALTYQLGHAPDNSVVSGVPLGSSQLAAIRSAIIRSPGEKLWESAAAGSHRSDHRASGLTDEIIHSGGIDRKAWMRA